MFKEFAKRKILVVSLSFLILLIIYLFPGKDEYKIHSSVSYTPTKIMPIYLVDKNDFVSRLEMIKTSTNFDDLIKETIDNLTINKGTNHIPNSFKKTIPEKTKLLSYELEGDLLKINFSKELLNVSKDDEEKLLESLVYSLTEIKEVNKIMIFIEGERLNNLPNSKKILPLTFDRNYGINKIYEINSMKDVSKITTYYVNKEDNLTYYTPITLITNTSHEKIEVIVERLKSSPTFETNLISYLAASTRLINYEILENGMNLTFSNDILSLDSNKIIEEVKYSISLSVRDTYNINKTIFFVDNNLMDVNFF